MTNADPDTSSSTHREPAADATSSTGPDAPFGAAEDASFDDASFDDPDAFSEAHFALELGKEWVRQHQTAAMLGAFAVGAFIGALLRD